MTHFEKLSFRNEGNLSELLELLLWAISAKIKIFEKLKITLFLVQF